MAFIQHKWIVFITAVMVAFLDYGFVSSFGALYVGMLDTFNAGRAKTAIVQSLVFVFCWGFGVVSGYLVSRFGVRIVSCCAAVLAALGFILSFFASSIYELYGYISVIASMGFATMYVSAVVCVGRSFTGKQKSMTLSLQSVGTALSGFMWPNVVSALFEAYGLRGTFLVLGGIFLNNIPCAIIFSNCENSSTHEERDNVKKHDKDCVEIDCSTAISEVDNEQDLEIDSTTDFQDVVHDTGIRNTNVNSEVNGKSDKLRTFDSPCENMKYENIFPQNLNSFPQNETSNGNMSEMVIRQDHETDKSLNPVGNGRQRITSLGEDSEAHGESVVRTKLSSENDSEGIHDSQSSEKTTNGPDITIKSIPDAKWCCSTSMVVFSIYTVAGVLHMSTLAGFLTVYQDINVYKGLTIAQSDLTFMSYALLNVLSRFLPIIPARFQNINLFVVPIVASLCGAIGLIIIITNSSLTSMIVAMAITAISDGGWVASMQAIVFELLPTEKQAVGFGFVLTSLGIAAGATGPIFGSIRDDSSSYQTVLLITMSTFLASALLESVCLVISQRFKR